MEILLRLMLLQQKVKPFTTVSKASTQYTRKSTYPHVNNRQFTKFRFAIMYL